MVPSLTLIIQHIKYLRLAKLVVDSWLWKCNVLIRSDWSISWHRSHSQQSPSRHINLHETLSNCTAWRNNGDNIAAWLNQNSLHCNRPSVDRAENIDILRYSLVSPRESWQEFYLTAPCCHVRLSSNGTKQRQTETIIMASLQTFLLDLSAPPVLVSSKYQCEAWQWIPSSRAPAPAMLGPICLENW